MTKIHFCYYIYLYMCSTGLVSEHLTKFFLFFKLVFFNYSLRFLAHMLTSEGVRPDPDKDNATEA